LPDEVQAVPSVRLMRQPSTRHCTELSLNRPAARMNISITQVFAAATNASSGVMTPACPCASGGAENGISGPLPSARCPQCSPVHRTFVW
jgi:hypothetical protein